MKTQALPKRMRLCSKVAIDRLFLRGMLSNQRRGSLIAYPLRAVWIEENFRKDDYKGSKILISIPKKRLRKAVDRVKMRRRIREAWRRNLDRCKDRNIDLGIVYLDSKLANYTDVESSIKKILTKLSMSNESIGCQD
ncbi:MAG: ribonuclease P protein component [Muribaculaceae bacterium]|nr:ribonuclease P protein component [Muribaculaceae bacterium]